MDNNTVADQHIAAVSEFYQTAGVTQDRDTAYRLIFEESKEVAAALTNLLKEIADLEYVYIGAGIQGYLDEDMPVEVEQEFLRHGHLANLIPLELLDEVFKRVHASNMSKFVDGKPLLREDGKILKGPNYQKPDLSDLI